MHPVNAIRILNRTQALFRIRFGDYFPVYLIRGMALSHSDSLSNLDQHKAAPVRD